MRRREFITTLGSAAALPLVGHAQQKMPRVGWLSPGSRTSDENFFASFRDGLRQLGWVVGQNIAIEPRWAEGKFERLPDLAGELVRLNVNVIVASVTQASLAAKHATGTIPIVMVGVGDPLGSGLVDSLARPGGNVTGLSFQTGELSGKWLDLLKEALPKLTRVAALWDTTGTAGQLRTVEAAAGE